MNRRAKDDHVGNIPLSNTNYLEYRWRRGDLAAQHLSKGVIV